MIAAALVFSLAVAALLSAAGYALEKAAGLYRLPRRGVWAITLLATSVFPLVMMIQANPAPTEPAASIQPTAASVTRSNLILPESLASVVSLSNWPNRPALDDLLAIGWGATSLGLLMFWSAAAWRLNRQAKGWPVVEVDGIAVLIADRFGPAVLGYLRPRIVMPISVLARPEAVRSMALKHEQSHVVAHDHELLFVALILVFLAPWNVALWWQLRRLRFAIEVDCDARVLNSGVETVAYGETLLSISQQGGSVPLGIVALTEPKSQLERRVRIMMAGPVRYRKFLMGLSLAIATSLVLAATSLSAPAAGETSAELRKPPPGFAGAPPEQFVALIRERYPTLPNHSDVGTPVLMVLFNEDGTIARTDRDYFQGSLRAFDASKALWNHFGLKPEHVGAQTLDFGTQIVLVVYGDKSSEHGPSNSKVFPDSRTIDRALAERFFPRAFQHGISAGEGIWVLFDRDGVVLRTGQEPFEAAKLIGILESRYPGIKATEMTVTPVVDSHMQPVKALGQELRLYSIWLDSGSALPGA